jgi:superfamily II DNA helicase RecQ
MSMIQLGLCIYSFEGHIQLQADIMAKYGLKGLVINSDTIHDAQLRHENLWEEVTTGPSMLFMAPEQLASPGFNSLAKEDGEFADRLCAIAIDEVHLLNTWGKG